MSKFAPSKRQVDVDLSSVIVHANEYICVHLANTCRYGHPEHKRELEFSQIEIIVTSDGQKFLFCDESIAVKSWSEYEVWYAAQVSQP